MEFLAASIGACAGYFAVKFMTARDIDTGDFKIDVDYQYVDNPRRVGKFELKVTLPREFPEKYHQAVMRAIKTCTVHNTFEVPPDIDVELI